MSAPPVRPWSEVEDRQIIELTSEGKNAAEVAKALGRSHEGVRQRLRGITLRRKVKLIRRKYPDSSSPLT